MYGTEKCALNRSERKKTETVEIRFLRHVSGYRLYLTGRVWNAVILNALQT
jgi:hypothetical protein